MSKHSHKARSTFEIKMDILNYLLKKGEEDNITHIMYNCNLSWILVDTNVDELIKSKCVTKRERIHGSTRNIYSITVKGIHALKHYKVCLSEIK